MARIRTIKPEFWTDEHVVEISPWARLLFIALWNFADDDGRLEYSPKRIKMQAFPSDSPTSINAAVDVDALVRQELEPHGMVHVYTVEGAAYLQVVHFHKHQKIDKRSASRFPAAPDLREQKAKSPNSHQTPPNPPESRKRAAKRAKTHPLPPMEWKGMEGNGKDQEKPNRGVWDQEYGFLSLANEVVMSLGVPGTPLLRQTIAMSIAIKLADTNKRRIESNKTRSQDEQRPLYEPQEVSAWITEQASQFMRNNAGTKKRSLLTFFSDALYDDVATIEGCSLDELKVRNEAAVGAR